MVDDVLRKPTIGSAQHLIHLLREKGATPVEIDQSHVHEDAMVDVYIEEKDVEFREIVREYVSFHFPMHVMVNIRWIGDRKVINGN